jgi:hypothetical protein
MLEEADLVQSTMSGNKRLFAITEEGGAWLEENRAELDKINAQLDEASGEISGVAISKELRALRHAVHDRLRSGSISVEQTKRARASRPRRAWIARLVLPHVDARQPLRVADAVDGMLDETGLDLGTAERIAPGTLQPTAASARHRAAILNGMSPDFIVRFGLRFQVAVLIR